MARRLAGSIDKQVELPVQSIGISSCPGSRGKQRPQNSIRPYECDLAQSYEWQRRPGRRLMSVVLRPASRPQIEIACVIQSRNDTSLRRTASPSVSYQHRRLWPSYSATITPNSKGSTLAQRDFFTPRSHVAVEATPRAHKRASRSRRASNHQRS